MRLLPPVYHRHRARVSSLLAIFLMAAQLVVALAPLGEMWAGRSYAPHVESGGTVAHLSHNEATCALCQARSIHSTTPRGSFLLPEGYVQPATVVADPVGAPAAGLYVHTSPRAPPSMI